MATLLSPTQQQNVSQQTRMPINSSNADVIADISGEALTIKYYASGVLTTDAGQAAGTVVVIKLANSSILNSLGNVIGNSNDTSLALTTGTILTTRVPFKYIASEQYQASSGAAKADALTNGFANGEYSIDHETGTIYGKKATTGTTDTAAYKVFSSTTSSSEQNALVPFAYDYVVMTYDASNNMLTAIFKTGGSGGATVATLTNTYDASNNLLTSTRT